jgi:hypothetical protein
LFPLYCGTLIYLEFFLLFCFSLIIWEFLLIFFILCRESMTFPFCMGTYLIWQSPSLELHKFLLFGLRRGYSLFWKVSQSFIIYSWGKGSLPIPLFRKVTGPFLHLGPPSFLSIAKGFASYSRLGPSIELHSFICLLTHTLTHLPRLAEDIGWILESLN